MDKQVFIVGCGYIGRRVARLEQKNGKCVLALSHSVTSAKELKGMDVEPVRGDLDEAASLNGLSTKGSLVYYFAPPPSSGKTDPRMEAFLSKIKPSEMPQRIVLLSTTGLYGDCQGEWITEENHPNPKVDRAFRRLSAEKALAAFGIKNSVEIIILRVPGVYGPGRLPEKRLRSGEPVLQENESPFSNRIHADDLASAAVAAGEKARPGEIYNVSDGHPSTMTDYFFRVADLLGIPRPPAISLEQAEKELGSGMLSYLAESKRIDNRKMLKELEVELVYPDLEKGLPSCI